MSTWPRLALVLVLAGAACAEGDAQFNVQYAPGFSKSGATVSVLGIFKDGRVNAESWDLLGPVLSAPFGKICETAYSKELMGADPGLASAVDDYARANGVTDALLEQFAPAARGDAILVITVAGHPPTHRDNTAAQGAASGSGLPSMRGGGSRGGMRPPTNAGSTMRASPNDRSVFEVSASLYSVRLRQSVALVAMTYTGASTDDALNRFSEKLRAALPGASCTGWNWDVHVDADRIRHLEQ